MKYQFLAFLLLCLFLSNCQETDKPSKNNQERPIYPEVFTKILDAHGGLEQWNAMNTLTFVKGDELHTTDLKTRHSLIEVEGKFKLGSDGKSVWVSPHRDSFPGNSPRFYHNLYFYFVAIPYVLADPGVIYEDQGEKMVNGSNYRVLKTGFKPDVGDAPDDQYFLYVDPETYKVSFITYSVTYFDKSRATSYNALKYDWAENNGLLVPAKMTGYKWEDGQLGEERYQRVYDEVQYSKEKVAPSTFEIPLNAFVE